MFTNKIIVMNVKSTEVEIYLRVIKCKIWFPNIVRRETRASKSAIICHVPLKSWIVPALQEGIFHKTKCIFFFSKYNQDKYKNLEI